MLKLLCKNESDEEQSTINSNWNNLENVIVNISQPCEDMMVACRFAANEYDCSKYFIPIITDEGLCCVFNMLHPKFMFISHIPLSMGNIPERDYEPIDWYAERGYPSDLPNKYYPRRIAGTGESLGLSITLDVEADKYYCSSTNSVGFKLSLHSPNESPNVHETGVLIAPGNETKVRVRPDKTETTQKLRSVDTKYRRCLFHDERKLLYFAHYTQRNCEMECIAKMLLQHCGCISFYMPKIYKNSTICNIRSLHCVEMVRLRKDPTIGSCLDACWPSCYDLTFLVDVFAIPLWSDEFFIENKRVQRYNKTYARKNIAVVNMYFKEYSFRSSIQTEFIGTTDFLSAVGGLMGLFLGFSFISIVELVYYAIIHPIRTLLQFECSKKQALSEKLIRCDKTTVCRQWSSVQRYKRLRKYLRLRATYGKANKPTKQRTDYKRLNNNAVKCITETLKKEQDIRT
ncbi:pickpocket protein 28 [Bactrocera oleae]|uniref:pickpocket protein 28 n=1 Tax=Bactrocera oleae TaxID=104688 RepID=UPI00387E4FBA